VRNWLLPEAIDDVLPAEAGELEALRRTLLDHLGGRGYRLVRPPLIEHLDSLLTGSGRDLELLTFKTVDPQSGRLVGIRADITPQVARIDAHLLNESGATRLCYAGSVVRARADAPGAAREVVQLGAELFGVPGTDGDREVIGLLVSSLTVAGLRGLHLDLGHMGVYRALTAAAGLADNGDDTTLFDALRTKDAPTVEALTRNLPAAWRDALVALPGLYGPADDVLRTARALTQARVPSRRIRRSLEESLERLGLDRLDIVYLHDPDEHRAEVLETGYPALEELRAAGIVTAIGAGMNSSAMLADLDREEANLEHVRRQAQDVFFSVLEALVLIEERGATADAPAA